MEKNTKLKFLSQNSVYPLTSVNVKCDPTIQTVLTWIFVEVGQLSKNEQTTLTDTNTLISLVTIEGKKMMLLALLGHTVWHKRMFVTLFKLIYSAIPPDVHIEKHAFSIHVL